MLTDKLAARRTVYSGVLLAFQQVVDDRREIVDEVRIRVDAAARLANGITLPVEHDNRGELGNLAAKTLERGLIGVA